MTELNIDNLGLSFDRIDAEAVLRTCTTDNCYYEACTSSGCSLASCKTRACEAYSCWYLSCHSATCGQYLSCQSQAEGMPE